MIRNYNSHDQIKTAFRKETKLTVAFFNVRYFISGNTQNDNFVPNAGAGQLFDQNNRELTEAYSGISTPIHTHRGLSSYGHSERLVIRDILDEFVPLGNGAIAPPRYYGRSPVPTEHACEVLETLDRNTIQYNSYLTIHNAIVKMWSERVPCDYPSPGGGSNCATFITAIFPVGSEYRYITDIPRFANRQRVAELNEGASGTFRYIYLEEFQSEPLGLTGLFEEVSD